MSILITETLLCFTITAGNVGVVHDVWTCVCPVSSGLVFVQLLLIQYVALR